MLPRQRIRRALVLVSFLLFPITIFFFSPALIIEGAAQGIIVGSFVTFGLLLLSSLFLGRAFCGWACPGAGLQESCFPVADKKAKGGRADWIKYFIWGPWIATIVALAVLAGGLKRVDVLYQTTHGISVAEPTAYIIYYFFLILIVVLAFTAGRRAFCHYVCWMAPFMVIGTRIKNALGWPSLHLVPHQAECIQCRTCTENCPMSLPVAEMVQKGSLRNSECILCGQCVDGCGQGAIRYSFGPRR